MVTNLPLCIIRSPKGNSSPNFRMILIKLSSENDIKMIFRRCAVALTGHTAIDATRFRAFFMTFFKPL